MVNEEHFRLPAFVPSPPVQEQAPGPMLDGGPAPRVALHLPGGLPASLHAEQTILGAMLVDAQAVEDASALLKPGDFSLESHRRIFEAIARLVEDAQAVDIVTVAQELRKGRALDSIGGMAYLAGLSEGLPRKLAIDSYVRIVRDKSLMRQMMQLFQAGMERSADQGEQAADLLDDMGGLIAEMAETSRVRRNRKVLIGGMDFIRGTNAAVEWAVDGLIQRGGNGVIVGDPGTAKSFSALDLAYHLAAGVSWLGHAIPERMKVAFVAREDHPGLTQHRAMNLLRGYQGGMVEDGLNEIELDEWLYFNTRAQSETFSLQNDEDVRELMETFQDKGIEIAFFDVFRRLWDGDENDNREVAKVLATLTRIQTECRCSVVLLHHLNKSEGGSIFQRIRGAGSIYGWREWAFGITIENPEEDPKDRIRKLVFETKAATPASPIFYCFDGEEDRVELRTCAPPITVYRKRTGKQDAKPRQDVMPWYAKEEA